jgi:hypothetical protein
VSTHGRQDVIVLRSRCYCTLGISSTSISYVYNLDVNSVQFVRPTVLMQSHSTQCGVVFFRHSHPNPNPMVLLYSVQRILNQQYSQIRIILTVFRDRLPPLSTFSTRVALKLVRPKWSYTSVRYLLEHRAPCISRYPCIILSCCSLWLLISVRALICYIKMSGNHPTIIIMHIPHQHAHICMLRLLRYTAYHVLWNWYFALTTLSATDVQSACLCYIDPIGQQTYGILENS